MTCSETEKFAYPSEHAARAAIKNLKRVNREGSGFIHAYRCGSHWHVGHGHKSTQSEPGRKFR